MQATISELDFDFSAYADTHLRRLAATTADPRFEGWLQDAGRSRDLPDRARFVVIGGGVGGTSIAYHLAQLGEQDVVLVDRDAAHERLDVPLRRPRRAAALARSR